MEEYWILKRHKTVFTIHFHAKANMTGITGAEGLLKMPKIEYYLKRGDAWLIRREEDRAAYMRQLESYVKSRPEEINGIMREGVELNGKMRSLMARTAKDALQRYSDGQLKELLLEYDDVVPRMWLQSTFIPYYVGDVDGFDTVIDLGLIKESRRETLADTAEPEMIALAGEALRRAGIHAAHPECATFEEVIGCFDGKKPDAGEFEERYEECFIEVTLGHFNISTGSEARKRAEKIFAASGEEKELKGTPAFKGHAEGEAFVAERASDLKDMKKGQILVTHMTTPDFVPYFDRVAAIVTDEGGITCHAAIVSREFRIPCVIGTRNATKAIKTGDRVEVDANSGVIRKL